MCGEGLVDSNGSNYLDSLDDVLDITGILVLLLSGDGSGESCFENDENSANVDDRDCSEVGTVAVFAVAAAAVPEYAFKIFPGRYCDQWNSIEGLYSSIVWLERNISTSSLFLHLLPKTNVPLDNAQHSVDARLDIWMVEWMYRRTSIRVDG
ncbi:unnamed protein product [Enterobius vermicularis]|uniref:Uncharacterized protein n=1 Tax=Enterobius vermicularis TaxID=51028 RepID=A0A0N4VHJ9_ENTVE|nr:unnamed protein product [Enterobius vermicularis]